MFRVARKYGPMIAIAIVVTLVLGGGAAIAKALNAKRLNGYKAKQLTRTTEAHLSQWSTGPGIFVDGTLVSAPITAPVDGYLSITASAQVFATDPGPTDEACWIALDGTLLPGSIRYHMGDYFDQDGWSWECSTNIAWPTAKGDHTVSLVWNNNGDTVVPEASIQADFSPFGPTGAVVTPVVPAATPTPDVCCKPVITRGHYSSK